MHYDIYCIRRVGGEQHVRQVNVNRVQCFTRLKKNLLNIDKTSRTVVIGKGAQSRDTLLKNSAKVTAYLWINCAEVLWRAISSIRFESRCDQNIYLAF